MWTSRRAGRLASALATPVLLAAALAGAGLGPAQAATAGCKSHQAIQPLSPGPFSQLDGTAVLSACNVWAVGTTINSKGLGTTLIEHWDGSKWKITPSPSPGAKHSDLSSVSAASPNNIWAVGQYDDSSVHEHALVLHWNGKVWTQQNTPDPSVGGTPGIDGGLSGVSAISGSQAWAVGSFVDNRQFQALLLHFANGKWSQVKAPVEFRVTLSGVAATSAKDVWAIGGFGRPDASNESVILHWNGKAWTRTPSPSPGFSTDLSGIAASSPTNALVVGDVQPENGPQTVTTLGLHWNGKAWTQVPTVDAPNATVESVLSAVAFTSNGAARAVGEFVGTIGNRPLVEQWNGKRFTRVKAPATSAALFSIAGSSASDQWAVGFTEGGTTAKAYALRFVG